MREESVRLAIASAAEAVKGHENAPRAKPRVAPLTAFLATAGKVDKGGLALPVLKRQVPDYNQIQRTRRREKERIRTAAGASLPGPR